MGHPSPGCPHPLRTGMCSLPISPRAESRSPSPPGRGHATYVSHGGGAALDIAPEGSVVGPPKPPALARRRLPAGGGREAAMRLCSPGRWQPWHPPPWLWVALAHPAAPGAAACPPDTALCFN